MVRRVVKPGAESAGEGGALASLAAAADAGGAPGGPAAIDDGAIPPPLEAAPVDVTQTENYKAIGFLLSAFRELGSRLLQVESLHRTLADKEVDQCARVMAPVAEKYGIDLGGWIGGVEAVALMTAGPILWTAYAQLDMELKAKRAKKAPAAAAAPPPATPSE